MKVFFLSRKAIRFFREVNPPGHGGKIINMSSVGGAAGLPGIGLYAACKFGTQKNFVFMILDLDCPSPPATPHRISALEGLTESLISELPPAWNIHATVLEPGGFKTNMLPNSILMPPHPAYGPDSPSRKYIGMLRGDVPCTGDPEKAAAVVWGLVAGFDRNETNSTERVEIDGKEMREWPVRLPLGSVAWRTLVEKAKRTLTEAQEWEDISHSTNFDGMGRDIEGI